MNLREIIESLCSVIVFAAAAALTACRLRRRNFFALRAALGLAALAAALFLGQWLVGAAGAANGLGRGTLWLYVARYAAAYTAMTAGVALCFRCNFWVALFCGTVGYCMENIGQRVFTILELLVLGNAHWLLREAISMAVALSVYGAAFWLFLRKNEWFGGETPIDNRVQAAASASLAVMLICVVPLTASLMGAFGGTAAYKEILLYHYIYTTVYAALAFLIELGLLSKSNGEREREIIGRILREECERYAREKENIDLINVKCHDLKHQIELYGDRIDKAELKEISDLIGIYDSGVKTGNEALDVILSQKNLVCRKKGIRLTCLLDGGLLGFIPPHELYSLFGNAVENAIDGVSGLPPEKRAVSIGGERLGGFFNIRIENYFDEGLTFKGGLPVTRRDKEYHGFGMKSIKFILEKHGGSLRARADGDIFILNMFLPVSP
ncbi:MAG: ATP-binding protein [Clostridiales bacterium]|jgi:hypothetical protein|nr:ATP-binding protein [Clostridiales bacterium]